jgi:hypothetical protein
MTTKKNKPFDDSKWNELANFMSSFYRKNFSLPEDLKKDPILKQLHDAFSIRFKKLK